MDSLLLGAGIAVLCIVGCLAASSPLLGPNARAIKNIPKYCQMYSLEQNCPSLRTIDIDNVVFLLRFKLAKWGLEHTMSILTEGLWGRRRRRRRKWRRERRRRKGRRRWRMLNTPSAGQILRLLVQRMECSFLFILNVCAVCWPEIISLYAQSIENIFQSLKLYIFTCPSML